MYASVTACVMVGDDEVRAWRADVAAKMAALEQRWEKSGHADLHALIGALVFCQAQLPVWVFSGVLKRLRTAANSFGRRPPDRQVKPASAFRVLPQPDRLAIRR